MRWRKGGTKQVAGYKGGGDVWKRYNHIHFQLSRCSSNKEYSSVFIKGHARWTERVPMGAMLKREGGKEKEGGGREGRREEGGREGGRREGGKEGGKEGGGKEGGREGGREINNYSSTVIIEHMQHYNDNKK